MSEAERAAALALLAPGTELRRGMESILAAGCGALVVIGADEAILPLVDGGFHLDCPFSAARLYELCKMDGAVLVSADLLRIRFANVQLQPDAGLPTGETGTRHRTAERVARQTGALVLAVSQRRGRISVYKGGWHKVLDEPVMVLARTNQALTTLADLRVRLDDRLHRLSALEYRDRVTRQDVVRVLQRMALALRIGGEIGRTALELGSEGGLVGVQLAQLVEGVHEEQVLVIRDYLRTDSPERLPTVAEADAGAQRIAELAAGGGLDMLDAARALGLGHTASDLDAPVHPRGLRQLGRVPRLPAVVAERLVERFLTLSGLMAAELADLDAVEGVGASRARGIRQALTRLRAMAISRRYGP